MRVITGSARGRRLKELEGLETRPTTDRVKEGMFNILQFDIEGRKVLDLFAGTGQLGIEALSRGADFAVFVDRRKDAQTLIRDNLKTTGLADRARVVPGEAMEYLKSVREKFDLDLTNEQLRHMLNVCAYTAEYYEDIDIDPNSGADIKVPSTGGHGGGGRRFPPIPVASDILEDIFGGGNLGSGMDLFVHFAELEACCRKLQQAIDYYNEAIEMTRAAAEELAANWEGDAKDAFVADQMEALRWYGGLRDVAAAVVEAIRQNSRRYSDTASRLADIMRG